MKNLLFVDDNAILLKILSRELSKYYNVTSFTSSKEALSFIRQDISVFDVVISDYKMPQVSGIQLLQEVQEKNQDAVRILLTGYADETQFDDDIPYHKLLDKGSFSNTKDIVDVVETLLENN